jgi:S-phase kinase-associated protein 1
MNFIFKNNNEVRKGFPGTRATSVRNVIGEMNEDGVVKLISSDLEVFEISIEAAQLSILVKDLIDEDSTEIQEIPLPKINARVLAQIVRFLNYYVQQPMTKIMKPLKSCDMSTLVQPFYDDFIRGDNPYNPYDLEFISELMLAANFMNIKPLLMLCGAAFASRIRGKNLDELKRIFGYEGELQQVDEREIREANLWALNPPNNDD